MLIVCELRYKISFYRMIHFMTALKKMVNTINCNCTNLFFNPFYLESGHDVVFVFKLLYIFSFSSFIFVCWFFFFGKASWWCNDGFYSLASIWFFVSFIFACFFAFTKNIAHVIILELFIPYFLNCVASEYTYDKKA